MKHLLRGTSCYLSGAIDADTSSGNWRLPVIETLTKHFHVNVFDPYSDPKQMKAKELHEAKEKNDFQTLADIAKDFVRKDLHEVDKCDFLIARIGYQDVYLPEDIEKCVIGVDEWGNNKVYPPKPRRMQIPTSGTIHEITNANLQKRPPLIVCEDGKNKIPSWLYGFIKHKYMFGSFRELYEYLVEVDIGLCRDERWNYVYKLI